MTIRRLWLGALVCGVGLLAAWSQTAPPGKSEEAASAADSAYQSYPESVRRRFEVMNAERMRLLDLDGNKKITVTEYLTVQREVFKKCDQNEDNVLTMDELQLINQLLFNTIGRLPAPKATAPERGSDPNVRALLTVARLDGDGNGLLSRLEFGGPSEDFDQADSDGDGWLDSDELARALSGLPDWRGPRWRMRDLLRRYDADDDGVLSIDEFPGNIDLFQDVDTNFDDDVSAKELDDYVKDDPRGAALFVGRDPLEPGATDQEVISHLFRTRDTNGDSRLSAEELEGVLQLLERFDADGDGFLTYQELQVTQPTEER